MPIRRSSRSPVIALALVGAAAVVLLGAVQNPVPPGDPLIAGFKSTYAASVSDAVELVTGRVGTMRYVHSRVQVAAAGDREVQSHLTPVRPQSHRARAA